MDILEWLNFKFGRHATRDIPINYEVNDIIYNKAERAVTVGDGSFDSWSLIYSNDNITICHSDDSKDYKYHVRIFAEQDNQLYCAIWRSLINKDLDYYCVYAKMPKGYIFNIEDELKLTESNLKYIINAANTSDVYKQIDIVNLYLPELMYNDIQCMKAIYVDLVDGFDTNVPNAVGSRLRHFKYFNYNTRFGIIDATVGVWDVGELMVLHKYNENGSFEYIYDLDIKYLSGAIYSFKQCKYSGKNSESPIYFEADCMAPKNGALRIQIETANGSKYNIYSRESDRKIHYIKIDTSGIKRIAYEFKG